MQASDGERSSLAATATGSTAASPLTLCAVDEENPPHPNKTSPRATPSPPPPTRLLPQDRGVERCRWTAHHDNGHSYGAPHPPAPHLSGQDHMLEAREAEEEDGQRGDRSVLPMAPPALSMCRVSRVG
ncbi:hypothetical protein MARPO_0098s0010 [Marchantia polymorpha]|uniref:Uncharacterized protein n=1 Tax=Marchantia polymorpha TaxID=3197 RepID=A0A2R6WF22_MARPO|nr:hypothetical protein MARPO_0098s0010 [Marchantia polymorpha]|eukprot:PTQ32454.1 hypothetical protein MARPO_0098s0010 [Marchantia polymorpha]